MKELLKKLTKEYALKLRFKVEEDHNCRDKEIARIVSLVVNNIKSNKSKPEIGHDSDGYYARINMNIPTDFKNEVKERYQKLDDEIKQKLVIELGVPQVWVAHWGNYVNATIYLIRGNKEYYK